MFYNFSEFPTGTLVPELAAISLLPSVSTQLQLLIPLFMFINLLENHFASSISTPYPHRSINVVITASFSIGVASNI